MKTTRILIPVLTLAAASLLMAQATPGSTPTPKGKTPAPAPPPAPSEAFPAPGDPVPPAPTPAPTVEPIPPAPVVPPSLPAPAIIPNPPPPAPAVVPPTGPAVPVFPNPTGGQLIVPNPLAPAPAANPLNDPRAEPFIGAGTISGTSVSARGRATIFSSLVFQFNKHEPVNIFEEIILKKPKAGEPRKWFRVQMPQDTGVWVHGQFLGEPFTRNVLNAQGQAVPLKYARVMAKRLNIRGGAGENHPVLGRLPKGATVRLSSKPNKGKWVELFAPANASVYVAAEFVTRVPLNQGVVEVPGAGQGVVVPPLVNTNPPPVQPNPVPPVVPVNPGVQPPPPETVLIIPAEQFGQPSGVAPDGTPIKRAGTPGASPTSPVTPKPPVPPSVVEVTPKPPITPTPKPGETAKPIEPTPKPVEPVQPIAPPASAQKPEPVEPPVRIVTREGIVRRTRALQAPTGYILVHLETGKTINYLLLDRPDIKLNWFEKQRVLVSGQEAIDPRAANTPVLKVKTLQGDVSPKAIQEFIVAREKALSKAREEAAQPEPEETQPKETPAPESEEPETPKPEGEEPEAPKPDAPKPEGEKPEAPKPDAPKPEGEKPEAPKPDAPKPEGEEPEAPKPEKTVDNK